jgi:hypothetical protein
MSRPNLSFIAILMFCLSFPGYSIAQTQEEQETLFFDALLKQTQKRNAVYTLQLSHIGNDIFEGTIFSDKKEVKAVGQWKLEDKRYLEHGQFVFFYSKKTVHENRIAIITPNQQMLFERPSA